MRATAVELGAFADDELDDAIRLMRELGAQMAVTEQMRGFVRVDMFRSTHGQRYDSE